jgi:hypothetical protein
MTLTAVMKMALMAAMTSLLCFLMFIRLKAAFKKVPWVETVETLDPLLYIHLFAPRLLVFWEKHM